MAIEFRGFQHDSPCFTTFSNFHGAGCIRILRATICVRCLAARADAVQRDLRHPQRQRNPKCRVSADERPGETAWVVNGAAGETLRRFVDSNGDNKVDEWRYFRGGIEVYRDVDKDYNGKADQYRWLGTAGTRWGLDSNEDGRIDEWKTISAEEVSAEIIEAIKESDQSRFSRILLSAKEVASLGLSRSLARELSDRIREAAKAFPKFANSQSAITPDTQWIDFGGLRPGTMPGGQGDFSKDLTVYENVVAMIETNGKPTQVPIGTLVRVGDGWRVVGLPMAKGADSPDFVFFEPPNQATTVGVSEKTQQLIKVLEEIDGKLASTRSPSELAKLNKRRADALEALAGEANTVADREMWFMQYADSVGTAAQSGTFPGGTDRLSKLRKQLEKTSSNKELLSHVSFLHMSADYAERLQEKDADFSKVQEGWLKELETFIRKYPNSSNSAEAMLQLALAKEFAGEESEANQWYTKIVKDFKGSPLSGKAAGAKRRLELVGKTMQLKGRAIDGKTFDIGNLRGKTVVVHYWATWCEPCKQDMELMKDLLKEYQTDGLEIVGVNLDSQTEELTRYFRSERPLWTHLYEEGGLDSRLASEMGVFTLPVMLLVDERGRVVNRQLHGAQLREELEKLFK